MFSPGPLSSDIIDFGGIKPGQADLYGWQGKPILVVHRTDQQIQAGIELEDYVHLQGNQPESVKQSYRSLQPRYGIFHAQTKRLGVILQYVESRPANLPVDYPWRGGFVDPASSAVFDPFGRRYKNTQGEALAIPPHRYLAVELIQLGSW